jgi:transcription initiation factor TFIIH subunit 4
MAVFRDLPELAKHFIIRLLFIEQPIHQSMVSSWVTKLAQNEHDEAVKAINQLKLWNSVPGALPTWILNDVYREGLKASFLGGGTAWTMTPIDKTKDKLSKDIASLDSYAVERWEMVLHHMVGSNKSTSSRDRVGKDTVETLIHARLITQEEHSANPMITADGFQFLLLDTSSQVWFFMTKYLETVESKGWNIVECLSFLFQMSFATLGRLYSSDKLSNDLQNLLQHLREFGLVYQRKRKDGCFYPTRLAVNLFSGLRDKRKDVSKTGYAIVETNYRVYAYTDSPLQIALLGLFTEMHYRFPGFCLGLLTRESVRSALKSGITAAQITNFLTINAHPSILSKESTGPVVPQTIADQIRLWEKERDRFIFKPGVLYSQFLSQGDFEILRNYARDAGYLVWDNASKRAMVVSQDGHEDVRLFWKRHKKSSKDKK